MTNIAIGETNLCCPPMRDHSPLHFPITASVRGNRSFSFFRHVSSGIVLIFGSGILQDKYRISIVCFVLFRYYHTCYEGVSKPEANVGSLILLPVSSLTLFIYLCVQVCALYGFNLSVFRLYLLCPPLEFSFLRLHYQL